MEAYDDSVVADPVDEMGCTKCGARIDVSDLDPFDEIYCPDCDAEQIVPGRLGGFSLLGLIGAGGMGGVYLARDEDLGRMVAIKVILRSMGRDASTVAALQKEAQAAARLNHPHVAQIYTFGQHKGQPFIVMELVTGRAVSDLIKESGALTPALATRVCLQIAEGLAAADAAGLVHSDVKPENILLDAKGNAKLVDFGIASFSHEGREEGTVYGSPYYISPERVKRVKATAQSDIYSLGATLFHALCGEPPFNGDTPRDIVRARFDAPAPDILSINPTLSPELARIVARMLELELTQRYPTYASLIKDLRGVAKGLPPVNTIPIRSGDGRVTQLMSAASSQEASEEKADKAKLVVHAGDSRDVYEEFRRRKEEAQAQNKARLARRLVVLGVVILLALSAGGFFVVRHLSAQKKTAAATAAARTAALARALEEQGQAYRALRDSVTTRIGVVTGKLKEAGALAGGQAVLDGAALFNRIQREADELDAMQQKAPSGARNFVIEKRDLAAIESAKELTAATLERESGVVEKVQLALPKIDAQVGDARSEERLARGIGLLQQYETRLEQSEGVLDKALATLEAAVAQARESLNALETAWAKEAAARRTALTQSRPAPATATGAAAAERRTVDDKRAADNALKAARSLRDGGDYVAATQTLADALEKLTTAGDRDRVSTALGEARRLRDLWTMTYASLAGGFPGGWRQGGQREDVLSADREVVKVGRYAVPWAAVTVPQKLLFFSRLLTDASLPVEKRADLALGVAFHLDDIGEPSRAASYARQAVSWNPELESLAARLVPDETAPGSPAAVAGTPKPATPSASPTAETSDALPQPVVHYRFDQKGRTVRDSSGNAFNGTARNLDYADRAPGNPAASFAKGGAHIDAGRRDAFALEDAMSVAFWVRCTTKEGELIQRSSTGRDDGYFASWHDGRLQFGVFNRKLKQSAALDVDVPSPQNWQFVVLVADPKASQLVGYVAGQRCGPHVAYKAPAGTPSISLLIGRSRGSYPHADFTGELDDVMIFDKALTPTQVKALYEKVK